MTLKYKYPILITALLLGLFGLIRGYYALTDDFRVSNIIYPMPERADWQFPLSASEHQQLQGILNQKFSYLGKGAQVYAFGSEDGKYVLKFFKFKHLKPSPFIALLPSIGPFKEIKEKNRARKQRKLEGVFEGHVIGYQKDRKNSALLYLHLNPSSNLHLQAHLIDKIGLHHDIDLDPIVFILQRKGETLRTVFTTLFSSGKSDLAALKATQVLDMYVDEYKHGVWDRDHGISHNIGFIEDMPFHLDVGKLSYDINMQSPEVYQADLHHVARKMDSWVKENFPEDYPPFHQILETHLGGAL